MRKAKPFLFRMDEAEDRWVRGRAGEWGWDISEVIRWCIREKSGVGAEREEVVESGENGEKKDESVGEGKPVQNGSEIAGIIEGVRRKHRERGGRLVSAPRVEGVEEHQCPVCAGGMVRAADSVGVVGWGCPRCGT